MSYVTKNYSTDGGNTLVIGGKLIVEDDAEVIGLDGSGARYVLPPATADTLGGVKVGNGLSVNEDGRLSADGYTLPAASADKLGGVKIGEGLSVDGNGLLSADGYTLPAASAEKLGGVKVGEGLSVDGNGVLSANGSSLPIASADTLGGVKVGSGLSINGEGVLSSNGGSFTPCGPIADLGNDPTISDIVRSFNALLSAMRSAGLMES